MCRPNVGTINPRANVCSCNCGREGFCTCSCVQTNNIGVQNGRNIRRILSSFGVTEFVG